LALFIARLTKVVASFLILGEEPAQLGQMGRKKDMPDNPNVELIRNAYDAFIKGDLEIVSQAFADDIVWTVPGRSPLAGVRHSKQEVFEFFGLLADRSGGTFNVEVHDVVGGNEHVVALATEHGERNGKTLNVFSSHVWRVRNGKAAEFIGMSADPYASDEFWS